MVVYAGQNLPSFTQFAQTTGSLIKSGARSVVNDAQATNYATLGYMLRGQQMSDILKGGSEIRDRIFLTAVRRSRTYKPGEPQEYVITETHKFWTRPYRFFLTDMSWNEETVLLNSGGESSDGGARFHQYKDYFWELRQQMETDQMNHWEELFWAEPNSTQMEGSITSDEGQEPASIPSLITEANGGAHPLEAGAVAYNGSGDLQGINPVTEPNWSNTVVNYSTYDATMFGNLVTALDEAWMKTGFRPPPMNPQYYEPSQRDQRPRPFLALSLNGRLRLLDTHRQGNDRWEKFTDAFFNPTYNGAPMVYVPELDGKALYNDGASALADEDGADLEGIRIYGIQPKYLRFCFHKDRYFESLGVKDDVSMPTMKVMPFNTLGNLVCSSRKRQFIITPTADVVTP